MQEPSKTAAKRIDVAKVHEIAARAERAIIEHSGEERNKNDLAYWFPLLEKTGVKVPRTTIVKAHGSVAEVVYGEPCEAFLPLVKDIREAAQAMGNGLPVFLRTGYGSGKHYWKETCMLPDVHLRTIGRHVHQLIEWSEIVDFSGLPTETWAVRELLQLDSSFYAFNGELPVNKERRYFFADGKVVCHHPYWPEMSIKRPSEPDWKQRLAELNLETAEEISYLSEQTLIAAEAFDGAWSLDWALAKDGNWYAIDMATANTSWHWPECEHRTFAENNTNRPGSSQGQTGK